MSITTLLWMALAAVGTFAVVWWRYMPEPVTGEPFDKSIVVNTDPTRARVAVSYEGDDPDPQRQDAIAGAVGLLALVQRHRPDLMLDTGVNVVGGGLTVVIIKGAAQFDVWTTRMRAVAVTGHWIAVGRFEVTSHEWMHARLDG